LHPSEASIIITKSFLPGKNIWNLPGQMSGGRPYFPNQELEDSKDGLGTDDIQRHASRASLWSEMPVVARGISDAEMRPEVHMARGEDLPYWASHWAQARPSKDVKIPRHGLPPRYCLQQIEDHHTLDFSERLNTSSYVNVVFEPEEEQVALIGMKINLADQTVYPRSFKLHNDVVNMIAKLWKCPCPPDFEETMAYAGAGTVGSTEACLLAGLALKFRWRKWYAQKNNIDADEVRGVYPNLIISTQFQACWEKFFKYFDVKPKLIEPSHTSFKITAQQVKDAIDDKTIGVVGILGNHYGGQYDPIWEINDAVEEVNKEKGYTVGIHVDAASGGFVAPFQESLPAWDFRLKNVLSISASGHKFGNSCCGTGWVVWRQREGLSEHVAINVSYLGGSADSYTLNFSRPAQGVYVQYYKFLRYGLDGYRRLCVNQTATAAFLRDELRSMEKEGKPRFIILDDHKDPDNGAPCLPVVTAMLNPELNLPYDDVDLQHVIEKERWYVSGYRMSFHHPVTEQAKPLFSDAAEQQTMFRIVVKSNLTMVNATHLADAIQGAVEFLDAHGSGYNCERYRARRDGPGLLRSNPSTSSAANAESAKHRYVGIHSSPAC